VQAGDPAESVSARTAGNDRRSRLEESSVTVGRSLLVAALLASAAACSSPSTPTAGGTASFAAHPPPSVEDAVRSYSGAFLSGQGEKAAVMLSTRCDSPALRTQIIQAATAAPALYGQARMVSITPTVDGERATVTYRFDQPAIDQENQPWVLESGAWRYDKC
jgi:hypothetical protein